MNALSHNSFAAATRVRWTCYRVPSQREKSSVEALERRGFKLWFPVEMKKVRAARHAKRKDLREFPLIPGYLFHCTEGGEMPPVYELSRFRNIILGVVAFGGKPAEIDPVGMARLQELHCQEPKADPAPHQFKAGDSVRVLSGPLEGVHARIESTKRARAIIDLLTGGRHIDVPLSSLELA